MPVESSPVPEKRRTSAVREWLLRLILVLASLLFVLAIAEIAARILRAGQGGGKEGREDALYKEYDPLLGWRKKANTATVYKRREYTVEVRINSRGLRDEERPPEPAPGVFRVLALGDSFLEGYTVDRDRTVTQQLEGRLRSLSCAGAAEVLNGGTSAYSTDQEYLFYRSEGARYRPSLVVLFFFWNDVIYSDRQEYFGTPKPVFEMGGGDLRLHRYPVKQVSRPAADPVTDAADTGSEGSALLEMIRERLWFGAPSTHDALAKLGLWNPIPRSNPRLEMLVYDRRDPAPVMDAWEKVGAILKALNQDVLAHGSRLAIAYIPGKMEIQESSWKATRQLYRLADGAWDLHRVRDQVARIGEANDIPVIDLGPSLQQAESTFQSTYFTFDGHWNARGHEVAAQTVFEWMKKTGALPATCDGTLPLQAASAEVWSPGEDARGDHK